MTALLFTALVTLSSNAFAMQPNYCVKNEGTDAQMSVTFDTGVFDVTVYETSYMPPVDQFTMQFSVSPADGSLDAITMVTNNEKVTTWSEGVPSEKTVTALFVYNPKQSSGRLTLIVDGKTYARNTLFTNCK